MRSSIPQAIAVLLSVGTSSALDQRDEPEHENPCHSYGIDFQDNGGPYFQNISSSDDFTFVSTFEGCEKDFATNIIVDPTGEQYQCTDTSLQPDNTYQMSTCPLMKNSLYSGDWSLIILGNNGDKEQFAYQRDFILTVGKPVTSTVTPTITIPAMTTPIVNSTSTHVVTDIATSTKTVTSAFTKSKTITVIPKRTTITKTKTLGTITKTAYKVMPTVTTITKTKTCSIPRRQNHQDPTCTIVPTIVQAAVFQTASSSTTPTTKPSTTPRPRRRDSAARRHAALDEDRAAFLAARSARLADSHALVIEKRGLDNSTVTITEPLTAKWQTATAWTTAAPSTMIVTVDRVTTVTSVSTKTEYKGVTKVVKTVTAPTPTKVKTKYTVIRTTSTITRRPNFTITTKSAPASSTAICKAKGGKLV